MQEMKDDCPDRQSKFEKDLQAFFPQIYKLHVYGKFDDKLWRVIDAIEEFFESREYGSIEITFQEGKINHATKKVSLEREVSQRTVDKP